ncbi:MAG TPA: hypothetical protein DEF04_11280 [Clostridiales bacterium]|nr:hypothetical protein [Clostridiales bacterium]
MVCIGGILYIVRKKEKV